LWLILTLFGSVLLLVIFVSFMCLQLRRTLTSSPKGYLLLSSQSLGPV
jgi:hypothetical protein